MSVGNLISIRKRESSQRDSLRDGRLWLATVLLMSTAVDLFRAKRLTLEDCKEAPKTRRISRQRADDNAADDDGRGNGSQPENAKQI